MKSVSWTSASIAFVVSCLSVSAHAELRTFTSRTGKTIEAEVTGGSGAYVALRDASGKEYRIAISKLSDEDREYIRTWRSERDLVNPPVRATKTEVADTRTGLTVPCREMHGQLFVRTKIRGREALLLVDTGVRITMLADSFAAEAGLEIEFVSPEALRASGGVKVNGMTRITDFEMANRKIPWREFAVVPDAELPAMNSEYAGVVGSDFLGRYAAVVDYGRKTLALDDGKMAVQGTKGTPTLGHLRAAMIKAAAKSGGGGAVDPKAVRQALEEEGFIVDIEALLPQMKVLRQQLGI